jgi:hypothetical protein
MKTIYDIEALAEIVDRINQIKPETKPLWGKMNAAQMISHLNVAYDIDSGKIKTETPALNASLFPPYYRESHHQSLIYENPNGVELRHV